MKTEVVSAQQKNWIEFNQMEMGVLYQVCEGESYAGAVVVRLLDNRAVQVGNFSRSWSGIQNNTIKVRPLPKGTQVVLTQE